MSGMSRRRFYFIRPGRSCEMCIRDRFMTFLLGIKFIVRPVMTTKEAMQGVSAKKRAIQSIVCGILIGFILSLIHI